MQHARRSPDTASTTIELVGLAAAVLVLVLATAAALRDGGPATADMVGARLGGLVSGGEEEVAGGDRGSGIASAARVDGRRQDRPDHLMSVVSGGVRGVRGARERRIGSDAPAARVARDDLRLSPALPSVALRRLDTEGELELGGTQLHGDASACGGCAGLGWQLTPRSGVTAGERTGSGRQSTQPGLGIDARANAHVALAALDVGGRLRRAAGPATLTGAARGRALVGADLDGRARLEIGHHEQVLELRGGAMAGAVARVEAKAGIDLLGVAIEQSGRAEGWAGAGARGVVSARREHARIEWRFGWGAALGLGGAAEWGGSIDVSKVPARHRRLARDALAAGAVAALPDRGAALHALSTTLRSVR